MKSLVLLTIALFLISAPAPDANDIAEFTSNFIVPESQPGLMAAEPDTAATPDQDEETASASAETSDAQPETETASANAS